MSFTNMKPGRYNKPPKGMDPKAGQVLLLMQGDSCLVATPEEDPWF